MTIRTVDDVLIVGGGYAGVHAARSIRRAGRSASIVDPTGRHDFVTRLAAVAGGTAPAKDASAPLSDFASEVILGTVTAVRDGEVDFDDGTTLRAKAVVVTAGAVPLAPPIDGLAQAFSLRTADDALTLRSEIAGADAVAIIGGGATGVQLAGAISTTFPRHSVTLIDGADRLLDGMGNDASHHAERILRERGVTIRLGSDVDAIRAHGVTVDGDHVVGLPVWAAGFDSRAADFGLPVDDGGRAQIDEFLRVSGWERTFVAGDLAMHRSVDGEVLPMSAQIAVQAGDAAGRNAVRDLDGEALEAVGIEHRGWVLDLGGNRGLAEIGPVTLAAPFFDLIPPLMHWAIDVKHLLETRGAAGFSDRPGA